MRFILHYILAKSSESSKVNVKGLMHFNLSIKKPPKT